MARTQALKQNWYLKSQFSRNEVHGADPTAAYDFLRAQNNQTIELGSKPKSKLYTPYDSLVSQPAAFGPTTGPSHQYVTFEEGLSS